VGDYFLMVTAMAPYKRIDIAIKAFNRLGRRLLIIGEGPGMRSLRKMAKTNVEFLGWLSDEKWGFIKIVKLSSFGEILE
jgi:glycosyltransferase involved in cell wall biosynthesis